MITEVDTANLNLSDMLLRLPPTERDDAVTIGWEAERFSSLAFQIWMLADIYSSMQNPRDALIVHGYLTQIAKGAEEKIFDRILRSINLNLAGLRSPATIAEALKIRDNLQKARVLIKATIP